MAVDRGVVGARGGVVGRGSFRLMPEWLITLVRGRHWASLGGGQPIILFCFTYTKISQNPTFF